MFLQFSTSKSGFCLLSSVCNDLENSAEPSSDPIKNVRSASARWQATSVYSTAVNAKSWAWQVIKCRIGDVHSGAARLSPCSNKNPPKGPRDSGYTSKEKHKEAGVIDSRMYFLTRKSYFKWRHENMFIWGLQGVSGNIMWYWFPRKGVRVVAITVQTTRRHRMY